MDPWGWEGDEQPPRGHHHSRFHGPRPAWAAVSGIMPSRHGIVPIQPYRLHRTQIPARGNDDGTNPLLVRTDRGSETGGQPRVPGNEAFADWVHGMEPVSTGRLLPMDSPVSFMNAVLQAIGGQGAQDLGSSPVRMVSTSMLTDVQCLTGFKTYSDLAGPKLLLPVLATILPKL